MILNETYTLENGLSIPKLGLGYIQKQRKPRTYPGI